MEDRKVELTKEQAAVIDFIGKDQWRRNTISTAHRNKSRKWDGLLEPLNSLTEEELRNALYNGYVIKEK